MIRRLLPFVLVVAIAGIAAGAGDARTTALTHAESTWVTPLLKVWSLQNAGIQLVGKTAAAKNALLINSANNKKLAIVLGTLLECKKPKDQIAAAGKAPTRRLRTFAAAIDSACTADASGAHAFTEAMIAYTAGKAKQTNTLIAQGTAEFEQASGQLVKAYRSIIAIGGTKVFTA